MHVRRLEDPATGVIAAGARRADADDDVAGTRRSRQVRVQPAEEAGDVVRRIEVEREDAERHRWRRVAGRDQLAPTRA